MNLRKSRINFDNAGSVQVWTRNYAHDYINALRAAEDVKAILDGSDPARWDGNDPDLLKALLAGETEKFQDNRTYTLQGIKDLLSSKRVVRDKDGIYLVSKDGQKQSLLTGASEVQFFRAMLTSPKPSKKKK